MDYLNWTLAFLAKWTLALGVLGTVSYQLFKHLGSKWLDAKFEQKSQALKEQHDKVMADIKAAQELNVRQVQSFIDKEMHRAKKLYDKEFDVLSEAWATLNMLYGLVNESSISEGLYDWDEASQEDIRIILDETTFTRAQKRQVDNAPGPDQPFEFRTIFNSNRAQRYLKAHGDFEVYLRSQSIFMPSDIRRKFEHLNGLIESVFVSFEIGGNGSEGFSKRLEVLFSDKNKATKNELDKLIHARFWSADGTKLNPQPEELK